MKVGEKVIVWNHGHRFVGTVMEVRGSRRLVRWEPPGWRYTRWFKKDLHEARQRGDSWLHYNPTAHIELRCPFCEAGPNGAHTASCPEAAIPMLEQLGQAPPVKP